MTKKKCPHPDVWFSRSIDYCEHGIEGMHYVCSKCGECMDHQDESPEKKEDFITQCPSCLCMTKTVEQGRCGKCGDNKIWFLMKEIDSLKAEVERLKEDKEALRQNHPWDLVTKYELANRNLSEERQKREALEKEVERLNGIIEYNEKEFERIRKEKWEDHVVCDCHTWPSLKEFHEYTEALEEEVKSLRLSRDNWAEATIALQKAEKELAYYKNGIQIKEIHWDEAPYLELKAQLSITKEGLEKIIKHQEFVGGSLSQMSTTKKIAEETLKKLTTLETKEYDNQQMRGRNILHEKGKGGVTGK